jgi:hypothetical protein
VLVVGSTCHIQMERFFYFTGTTEQEGQRWAKPLSSTNPISSDVLTDKALQETKFVKLRFFFKFSLYYRAFLFKYNKPPINALENNKKVQYFLRNAATCFGTAVPSSGSSKFLAKINYYIKMWRVKVN